MSTVLRLTSDWNLDRMANTGASFLSHWRSLWFHLTKWHKSTFSRHVLRQVVQTIWSTVIHYPARFPIFKTKYTEIKAIIMFLFLSKYLFSILVDIVFLDLTLFPPVILSCANICQFRTKLKGQLMISFYKQQKNLRKILFLRSSLSKMPVCWIKLKLSTLLPSEGRLKASVLAWDGSPVLSTVSQRYMENVLAHRTQNRSAIHKYNQWNHDHYSVLYVGVFVYELGNQSNRILVNRVSVVC